MNVAEETQLHVNQNLFKYVKPKISNETTKLIGQQKRNYFSQYVISLYS